MIRDITLGQYYPADSVLHRLDPRTKLFGTLFFILSVFSFRGAAGFALVTVCMFAVIFISRVPLSFMLRGLRSIMILLIVAAMFNLFLTPGQPLIGFWKIVITKEGLRNAVLMTVRMIYLIMGTSVMTLTTTPNQLTNGLETSLKPLNRIHVPVHEIAMMMSIALRFIPILIEETDKIMKAQMARGADFETGGLIKRAKNMVPLLVPLFVSAFRRANDLALAMEARCYTGGEGRTRMIPLRYTKEDRVSYVLIIAYFLLVLILKYAARTWPPVA